MTSCRCLYNSLRVCTGVCERVRVCVRVCVCTGVCESVSVCESAWVCVGLCVREGTKL